MTQAINVPHPIPAFNYQAAHDRDVDARWNISHPSSSDDLAYWLQTSLKSDRTQARHIYDSAVTLLEALACVDPYAPVPADAPICPCPRCSSHDTPMALAQVREVLTKWAELCQKVWQEEVPEDTAGVIQAVSGDRQTPSVGQP